jgi:hypothetical protein
MSETQTPQSEQVHKRPDAIFDEFVELDDVSTEWVRPGRPLTMNVDLMPIMGESVNKAKGTSQVLRAVIEAGNELFGIVQASSIEGARAGNPGTLVITRFARPEHGEGARAQVVQVVRPGTGRMYGREQLREQGFSDISDEVSKVHFGLALSEDGKQLVLSDENSTNGTRIASTKVDRMQSVESALGGFEVWSPPTQAVAEAIVASATN